MMKHRISAFLLAALLAVTAAGCSAQEPEDSAGLPESSAGTAVRSEAFYPAEAGYTVAVSSRQTQASPRLTARISLLRGLSGRACRAV